MYEPGGHSDCVAKATCKPTLIQLYEEWFGPDRVQVHPAPPTATCLTGIFLREYLWLQALDACPGLLPGACFKSINEDSSIDYGDYSPENEDLLLKNEEFAAVGR